MNKQSEEQARLDQAMQRGDDMLVSSLRRDDQMRKAKLIIGGMVIFIVVLVVALVIAMNRGSGPRQLVTGGGAVSAESAMQEGWQLWQQRRMADAEAKFNEALKADPKLVNAWNGLGWARFNSGKTEPAIEAFAKCVELDPNHPAALNGLGQAYYAKKQFDKAEPMLIKAADNKATAAWWGLAKMYLLQGKWAEAEKWAQKIVDSGDKSAEPLLDAAKAKALPDGLRDTISPMSAKGPAPKSNAHVLSESWGIKEINRAYALQQKGDVKAAEAVLKTVMARPVSMDKPDLQTWVPQLFVAPLKLAEMWQEQGKVAEADELNRKVAAQVIELDRKFPNEKIWIPGYAAQAYSQRITALLQAQPPKVAEARALAEEFKKLMPSYTGFFDYGQMNEAILAAK